MEKMRVFFRERLTLYKNELDLLERIRHPGRRLEWFASRLCVKMLLNIDHEVESLNRQDGRPFLTNDDHNISYSHSGKYATVIASRAMPVAIDIESFAHKRNPDTYKAFMNTEEQALYEAQPDMRRFLLCWSAKESLYKLLSGPEHIGFAKHLAIEMQDLKLEGEGCTTGRYKRETPDRVHDIHYVVCPDYLITYTF